MKNIKVPAQIVASLTILILVILGQIDFVWQEVSPGYFTRQVGPLKFTIDRSYPLTREVQTFSRPCTDNHQKHYTVSWLKGASHALFVWCDGRPNKFQELPAWWDIWFSEVPGEWPAMPKASPAIAPSTLALVTTP